MLMRKNTFPKAQAVRGAFTLLEILIVVAIIVMLAGAGGYYLLQRYEEAKLSKAKMDVSGLAQQAKIYYMNNNAHAPSVEALTENQPNGGSPLVKKDAIMDPWG